MNDGDRVRALTKSKQQPPPISCILDSTSASHIPQPAEEVKSTTDLFNEQIFSVTELNIITRYVHTYAEIHDLIREGIWSKAKADDENPVDDEEEGGIQGQEFRREPYFFLAIVQVKQEQGRTLDKDTHNPTSILSSVNLVPKKWFRKGNTRHRRSANIPILLVVSVVPTPALVFKFNVGGGSDSVGCV